MNKFERIALRLQMALLTAIFAIPLLFAPGVTQPAAAAVKLSQAGGDAGISAIGALLNGGTMKIYCGTQPTNPDTALSGNTLAATFTFNTPAFGSSSLVSSKMQITGSLAATTVTAVATCTASFARFLKSDGTTVVADWTVGTSGTDVVLNSTAITSGGNVTISSLHFNMPVD